MLKLSESQIGYLAGFVDGEGAVSIKKKVSTKQKSRGYVLFVPFVIFTQKNGEVLFAIARWIGLERSPRFIKKRSYWVLEVGYRRARELLEVLKPRLIVKRRHAEIVLSMPNLNQSGRKRSESELARQIEAYESIAKIQMKVNNKVRSRKVFGVVDGRYRVVSGTKQTDDQAVRVAMNLQSGGESVQPGGVQHGETAGGMVS